MPKISVTSRLAKQLAIGLLAIGPLAIEPQPSGAIAALPATGTDAGDAGDAGGPRPDPGILDLALAGFRRAVAVGDVPTPSLLTVIDYSLPSTAARLFVIDPDNSRVLRASLVAHGKNSGEDRAEHFGNTPGSLQSSPGFFVTGETYQGRHGYSLRLHGLEPGINDNAARRNIVIHGADYVSQSFVSKHGRLGRSWGCPALPREMSGEIIDLIKSGTCLFVYCDDPGYLEISRYIGETLP